MKRVGLATGLLLGLWLTGCRSVSPTLPRADDPESAYAGRHAALSGWSEWGFSGKLSVDDGEDGGSGRLRWTREGELLSLSFRGALGRGAWELNSRPGTAVLRFADGEVTEAPDVEALIESQIGWTLPLGAMEFWVRGLTAPGTSEQVDLDDWGRPVRLVQRGWTVEFSRYEEGARALPGRIEATRPPYRVKLVVGQWDRPDGDPERA